MESLGGQAELQEEPEPSSTPVRDPDDAYLVALSEAADALIVTGDDNLLSAGLTPPAVTPTELLHRIWQTGSREERPPHNS